MAMTKKERAEFDAAISKAELIGALRWTSPVKRDVSAPKTGYVSGWDCNARSGRVWLGWSGSVSHGEGLLPDARHINGSQNARAMFSSKEKALAAMRHEKEHLFAQDLACIDQQLRNPT